MPPSQIELGVSITRCMTEHLTLDFKAVSVIQKRCCHLLSVPDMKKSEYDQEIPQSQTTDKPMAPRGRATL